MPIMSNASHTTEGVRTADVASMQDAVLELHAQARKSQRARDLPPVEFALRYGAIPPVLAGRASEMRILRSLVHGVQNHKGDQCLLGLHGIRGQGKTALIRILADMACQASIQVVTLGASATSADFAQAMNVFAAERLRHYQTRFLELEKIGAVECARNVAEALNERGFITRTELKQCVSQGLRERRSLEQAGDAIREDEWLDGLWSAKGGMAPALLHRGFLWSPEGDAGDRFQAGISSLANYMLETASPPPWQQGLSRPATQPCRVEGKLRLQPRQNSIPGFPP